MAAAEVGNDVVDLRDADTDPRRPRDRFDARICGPEERRALEAAADPTTLRWCLWAAKEASYKLLRKRVADVVFSPVRFEVSLQPSVALGPLADGVVVGGRVTHGTHSIELVVTRHDDAIHAVATWPDRGRDVLVVEQRRLDPRIVDAGSPAGLSRAVRALVVEDLSARLGVDPARLTVVKRNRIPELRLDGAPSGTDLSLSHHGRVVAFACGLGAGPGAARLAS